LLNAGLDIAYIVAGGWVLREGEVFRQYPTRTTDRAYGEELTGIGQGLIVQGAGLFLFDMWQYYRLTRQRKGALHAEPALELSCGYNCLRIGLTF